MTHIGWSTLLEDYALAAPDMRRALSRRAANSMIQAITTLREDLAACPDIEARATISDPDQTKSSWVDQVAEILDVSEKILRSQVKMRQEKKTPFIVGTLPVREFAPALTKAREKEELLRVSSLLGLGAEVDRHRAALAQPAVLLHSAWGVVPGTAMINGAVGPSPTEVHKTLEYSQVILPSPDFEETPPIKPGLVAAMKEGIRGDLSKNRSILEDHESASQAWDFICRRVVLGYLRQNSAARWSLASIEIAAGRLEMDVVLDEIRRENASIMTFARYLDQPRPETTSILKTSRTLELHRTVDMHLDVLIESLKSFAAIGEGLVLEVRPFTAVGIGSSHNLVLRTTGWAEDDDHKPIRFARGNSQLTSHVHVASVGDIQDLMGIRGLDFRNLVVCHGYTISTFEGENFLCPPSWTTNLLIGESASPLAYGLPTSPHPHFYDYQKHWAQPLLQPHIVGSEPSGSSCSRERPGIAWTKYDLCPGTFYAPLNGSPDRAASVLATVTSVLLTTAEAFSGRHRFSMHQMDRLLRVMNPDMRRYLAETNPDHCVVDGLYYGPPGLEAAPFCNLQGTYIPNADWGECSNCHCIATAPALRELSGHHETPSAWKPVYVKAASTVEAWWHVKRNKFAGEDGDKFPDISTGCPFCGTFACRTPIKNKNQEAGIRPGYNPNAHKSQTGFLSAELEDFVRLPRPQAPTRPEVLALFDVLPNLLVDQVKARFPESVPPQDEPKETFFFKPYISKLPRQLALDYMERSRKWVDSLEVPDPEPQQTPSPDATPVPDQTPKKLSPQDFKENFEKLYGPDEVVTWPEGWPKKPDNKHVEHVSTWTLDAMKKLQLTTGYATKA